MGKARLIGVVLMGFVLITGCAQETPPAESDVASEPTPGGAGRAFREEFENIDPCTLLTSAEIGEALDEEMEAGERTHELICTWEPAEAGGTTMTVRTHGEGRNPRGICSGHRENGEQVKGIGLDAAYSEDEGLAIFTQGIDHACVILNTDPAGELTLDQLKGLGELILTRPPFNGEGGSEAEAESEA